MRFIVPLLAVAALTLSGCLGASFDPDTGAVALSVEPLASASSVAEVADMAKDYADDLADAVSTLAETVEDPVVIAMVDEAKASAGARKDAFDVDQLLQSELFWTLLGMLGLGTGGTVVARRKIKAAKAALPDDFEEVEEMVA